MVRTHLIVGIVPVPHWFLQSMVSVLQLASFENTVVKEIAQFFPLAIVFSLVFATKMLNHVND